MKAFIIYKIFITIICIAIVHSKFDFTNVRCITFDNSTVYFDKCFLKAVNRNYKYLTISIKLPKREPINDITVNFAMQRKENGYKPFLYNLTIDACKYLKNRRSNPVISFAHSLFEKYSTINKTCPYGERDELVDKLPVSHINRLVSDVLPVPRGDYAALSTYYFYNKKAIVHSKFDFTNVLCITFDNSTVYSDKCFLKAVNRTYKYLTISIKFPKREPINDITVNFAVQRKENGYKPFLYNITIDACKYLKNRRSNPVISFAHSFFEKYSTINKTCPYGERDEIVDKLPVSHINRLVSDILPVPHGDYAYSLTFYFYNKKVAAVTAIVHSKFDFTNVRCMTFDNSTIYFEKCFLKAVNRTYKYLTISIKLPKREPINDITVNFAVQRKENGYKPFLYNLTIDACKYLKNRRSNPVLSFAHSLFEKYSTINKTCPYGERDEIVDKLPVSHINRLVSDVLPVPHGDYAYSLTFYFYNKKVAAVTVYATLS